MQNRYLAKAFGFVALVALASSPAIAASDPTPNDESLVLSKIDTDHDHTISLDEAKVAAAAKFGALDTDKENTLDASELTGIVSVATLKTADPDKDGTLDKAEYMTLVTRLFQSVDHDHDGTLDAKELTTDRGRALVALLAY